jgi:hypothetical protein
MNQNEQHRISPILSILSQTPARPDFKAIETLAWVLDAQAQTLEISDAVDERTQLVASYVHDAARSARALLDLRRSGVIQFVSGEFAAGWSEVEEGEARMVEQQIADRVMQLVEPYQVEQAIVGSDPTGPSLILRFRSGLRVAWGGPQSRVAMLFQED